MLAVALQLNQKQIPIRYIGIWDAAFDRIDRRFDSIPSKVNAKEKRNWYQTYGEKLDTECNQEVHAPVDGFENINLDKSAAILALQASSGVPGALLGIGGQLIPLPGKLRQIFWNSAHDYAYGLGKEGIPKGRATYPQPAVNRVVPMTIPVIVKKVPALD